MFYPSTGQAFFRLSLPPAKPSMVKPSADQAFSRPSLQQTKPSIGQAFRKPSLKPTNLSTSQALSQPQF